MLFHLFCLTEFIYFLLSVLIALFQHMLIRKNKHFSSENEGAESSCQPGSGIIFLILLLLLMFFCNAGGWGMIMPFFCLFYLSWLIQSNLTKKEKTVTPKPPPPNQGNAKISNQYFPPPSYTQTTL